MKNDYNLKKVELDFLRIKGGGAVEELGNILLSNKTIHAYFQENSRNYPQKTAFFNEEESYTWSQSYQMYCYLIRKFQDFGMGKGKIVAIVAPRHLDTPFVVFAAVATQAYVMLCDPKREIGEFLKNCTGKISPDYIIRRNLFGTWILECKDGQLFSFDKKVGLNFMERVTAPLICDEKEGAYIFFTSGSTGKCKAALLSQYALLNNTKFTFHCAGCNADDKTLVAAPLYHVLGISTLLEDVMASLTCMIPLNRAPGYILDIIERYRCTRMNNVPTYFYLLIEEQNKCPRDITSLKKGVIGGGSYSKQQFQHIASTLGLEYLCPVYGMTETSTMITYMTCTERLERRSESLGKPSPYIDWIVKDLHGKRIEDLQKAGELCVKGNMLMLGYIEEDGNLSLPLDDEGYFHTGDMVRLDEEGFVYIVGRCKDTIIRGGENISPLPIQNKISEMEGVIDVCVLGVPSEKYGEEVGACVQAECVTAEEITAYLKEFLTKYEIPSRYVFVEKIPLLGVGKPDKKRIIQLFSKS